MITISTFMLVTAFLLLKSDRDNNDISDLQDKETVRLDALEKLESAEFLSGLKRKSQVELVEVKATGKIEEASLDSLNDIFAKEYDETEVEDHDHGHDEKMRDHVLVRSKNLEEVRKRLSLLSSLNKKIKKGYFGEKQTKELLNLFVKVANTAKENWSVRRQAVRNILNIPVDIEKRNKILKVLDKRILHLARFSDAELFKEAVNDGKSHQ